MDFLWFSVMNGKRKCESIMQALNSQVNYLYIRQSEWMSQLIVSIDSFFYVLNIMKLCHSKDIEALWL